MARDHIMLELVSRAVARMGLRSAIVDPAFPLAIADRLRADGVILTPDHDTFASRRRTKSPAELAGIRRAQKAAEAGMAAAAAVLRAAVREGDKIVVAVEPGLWDRNVGALGSEDLVLVTEDGHEVLTDYPYDLKP